MKNRCLSASFYDLKSLHLVSKKEESDTDICAKLGSEIVPNSEIIVKNATLKDCITIICCTFASHNKIALYADKRLLSENNR